MSADLSSDGIAPEDWKPLHPLTYVPRVVGSVTGVVGAVSLSNASAIERMLNGETPAWLATTGVFLGLVIIAGIILAIAGAYCYLSWTKTRYAVSNTAIWYRARHPQAHAASRAPHAHPDVNVSYSLVGRLLRLGYLDIEVAGGGDSSIKLGLLPAQRLEELRALLLALASGAIDEVVDPAGLTGASTRVATAKTPLEPRSALFQGRLRQAPGVHAGDHRQCDCPVLRRLPPGPQRFPRGGRWGDVDHEFSGHPGGRVQPPGGRLGAFRSRVRI